MADDDALVVIATHLLPQEAGLLQGLLESAGIDVVLRDEVLSAVNPFLQSAIGGVKLAVRAADAGRAHEIIRSAGAVPGRAPDEPVDIPEEEWSRTSDANAEVAPPARATWPRRILAGSFFFVVFVAVARCLVGV